MSRVVQYRALQPSGEVVNGRLVAADLEDARLRLRESGLTPIRLHTAAEAAATNGRVSRRQWALLFRALASLVEAGMPLDRALSSARPLLASRLVPRLDRIQRAVQHGLSLGEALEGSEAGAPRTVIGMIRAGERAGRLASTLDQAASHLERENELIGKVRQALAYPILLACVGTAAVAVIALVVLPRFAGLIEDAGQRLPAATRLLLAGSAAMKAVGLWWLVLVGFGLAAFHTWWGRATSKLWIARQTLSVPVLGSLLHSLAGARVARGLGGMLEAGMPLLLALDGVGSSAGNVEIEARIARARIRVARGEPLTEALGHERVLPTSILPLVALGEHTGQLGSMALRAGGLAASEAERTIGTLVSILEPGMIVIFGGLVAFVAAALLQAVYSLRPS